MLDHLILAFSGPKNTRDAKPPKDSIREIVRARSHGNIRLQWGQFYTKKDVDAQLSRLRKVDFID
jgi:hypothetical protein